MDTKPVSFDTPLYELIAPQPANYCWRSLGIRTLGDFAQRIEEKKIRKNTQVPWLFYFNDIWKDSLDRPGKYFRIGKKSWETILTHLDELGFEWRNHIVNRVTYRPIRQK